MAYDKAVKLMNEEKNEETPEVTPEEKPKEEAPTPPSEVTPETVTPEPAVEPATPEEPEDIDFDKKLADIESQKTPKHSPKEKVAHNLRQNAKRAEELGVDPAEVLGLKEAEVDVPLDASAVADVAAGIVRRERAEERAREDSTSDSHFKVIMHFYDLLGNYDDAIWQANKGRTKNAIIEMKRVPEPTSTPMGPGQVTPSSDIPLPHPDTIAELEKHGLRKVAPDKWEGETMEYVYNKETKIWEEKRKSVS